MRITQLSRFSCLLLTGLLNAHTTRAATPLSLTDYLALHGPAPTEHVAYGEANHQYVEWFKPAGSGPYPVVVLIHGGCFLNHFEGMPQMRSMAGALLAHGVAVWSVDYRGLDTVGGGYPGTFLDIRAALDLLQRQATERRIDLSRVVLVGHSAGGVLALWAAGRGHLPKSSALYEPHPLLIPAVIALGASGDLRSLGEIWKSRCDLDIRQLTGSPDPLRTDVYADTNPLALAPNGSVTLMIDGDHDTIMTPKESADYATQLRQRGDSARTLVMANAGHFDEVAADTSAWSEVQASIMRALRVR